MKVGASQRSHWMRCFLVALAMHGGVVATALWLRVDEAPVEASMDAFLVELASDRPQHRFTFRRRLLRGADARGFLAFGFLALAFGKLCACGLVADE